jgi:Protein of unknown function (DUF3551)
MRLLQASLIAAALLAAAPASHAQSAYDYPWCAVYGGRSGLGAVSCYYASYGQCMQTMSGIGGYCIRSPYYGRGPRVERDRRRDYREY